MNDHDHEDLKKKAREQAAADAGTEAIAEDPGPPPEVPHGEDADRREGDQRGGDQAADGALQPCSMQFKQYRLEDRERMIEEFTGSNTCDECYVSIRSYLDKSFPQLLWENVSGFLSVR